MSLAFASRMVQKRPSHGWVKKSVRIQAMRSRPDDDVMSSDCTVRALFVSTSEHSLEHVFRGTDARPGDFWGPFQRIVQRTAAGQGD